jgi:hypothetical protein
MSSDNNEARPDSIEDLPALEKTEAVNTDGVKGGMIIVGGTLQDPPEPGLPQLADPPEPIRTSYIK